ncbi:MAG TPA: GntR family transcriptional regulator [Gemmatimonadaceae bacterium]|nr:GntR family transcriptional regulator [Gemmatimonadaceae bacterium]
MSERDYQATGDASAPLLDRTTLVDRAVAVLRQEIITGVLPPDTLIHIGATAERLGVSTIPIREALRTLASEGLVVPVPQRGFCVRPISAADLIDTYRMRLILDPLATRWAIPRLTADDIQRLAAILDALRAAYAANDQPAIHRLHRAFHFGIYEAAGSPWLLRFLSMLWENSQRYLLLVTHREAEHRRILDACATGDPALAERLVRAHLEETRHAVLQRLGVSDAGWSLTAGDTRRRRGRRASKTKNESLA